jgi:fluoroquinolone transport system permease protein
MKYRALLVTDGKQMLKDPMLMTSLLGPLAVIAFARFVFPPLAAWLEERYAFDLTDYTGFVVSFLLTTVPLLPGTMAGLLMLDERDENMVVYYGVTPLTRKGYYSYRLFLPSLLALLLTGLFFLLSGMAEIRAESGYALLLFALEAPWIALFLAAVAANKVEGLALSKLCGLLLFAGPVVVSFVPEPWQYLGIVIPTYWPAKSYMLGISNEPVLSSIVFIAGFLYHIALLKIAVRAFSRRMD